jgi:hypothetical protein
MIELYQRYVDADGQEWQVTALNGREVELEAVDQPARSMVRSRSWVGLWTVLRMKPSMKVAA